MPLEGIRVLDLSGLAPGPYCTMLLGDLGADVILVEATPGAGRRMGGGEAAEPFNPLRRNKRSIGLNLKEPLPSRLSCGWPRGRTSSSRVTGPAWSSASASITRPSPHATRASSTARSAATARPVRTPTSSATTSTTSRSAGRWVPNGWPGEPPAIPLNLDRRLRRRRPVRGLRDPGRDHRARRHRPRPVRRHGDERRRHLPDGDGDGAVLRGRALATARRGLP